LENENKSSARFLQIAQLIIPHLRAMPIRISIQCHSGLREKRYIYTHSCLEAGMRDYY